MHDAGGLRDAEVGVKGRAAREAVARQRGHDDVVRQRVWGVLGAEQVEQVEELTDGPRPAVHEDDGDGVGARREERQEVHLGGGARRGVPDRGAEARARVEPGLGAAPVVVVQPGVLGGREPLAGHAVAAAIVGVLESGRADGGELEQGAEVLEFGLVDVDREGLDVDGRA